MGSITFNGVSSESLGIKVWTFPTYVTPEKEVTSVHIPGRNGDIVIDSGAYKNVTRSYQISLYSKALYTPSSPTVMTYTELANKISNWLQSAEGYAVLSDTYEPDYYRMAMYVQETSIQNVLNQAGIATIDFICKPQRFLFSGDAEKSFSSSSTITNPTTFASKPTLKILGNGTATINGRRVTVSGMSSGVTLYVDCDIQDAYYYSGSVAQNANNKISTPDGFPFLKPGSNTISLGSGISSVKVVPKWWTL